MYESRGYTVAAIAKTLGVSRNTVYNHLGAGSRGRREVLELAPRQE